MNTSNFAQAQRASYTQRPPDRHPRSARQVPAARQAKALADFRVYFAQAKDDETRRFCAAEIRRLGGTP